MYAPEFANHAITLSHFSSESKVTKVMPKNEQNDLASSRVKLPIASMKYDVPFMSMYSLTAIKRKQ